MGSWFPTTTPAPAFLLDECRGQVNRMVHLPSLNLKPGSTRTCTTYLSRFPTTLIRRSVKRGQRVSLSTSWDILKMTVTKHFWDTKKKCHAWKILIELWATENNTFHTHSACVIHITFPRITQAIFTSGLHCKLSITRSASLILLRFAIFHLKIFLYHMWLDLYQRHSRF